MEGFCPDRPSNGKSVGDISLKTLKPFSASQILAEHFSTNQVSFLATVKLAESLIDEFYLLRFIYSDKWIGLRIGTSLNIDFYDNVLNSYEFDIELKDNTWHRLGLSIDETTLEFFSDCELIGSFNMTASLLIVPNNKISIEIGFTKNKENGFEVSFNMFCYVSKNI